MSAAGKRNAVTLNIGSRRIAEIETVLFSDAAAIAAAMLQAAGAELREISLSAPAGHPPAIAPRSRRRSIAAAGAASPSRKTERSRPHATT